MRVRPEDDVVPVYGYQEDGEGGEEDTESLQEALQLADDLLEIGI